MSVRFLLALCVFMISSWQPLQAQSAAYDSALAVKFHADERGMHLYILAILTTGPVTITDKARQDSLFSGHMANITRLSEKGLLSVAGPFEKNDRGYRGVFVLNAATVDEAKTLVQTDPAVQAGMFAFELFPWYCTAALEAIPDLHKKLVPPGR